MFIDICMCKPLAQASHNLDKKIIAETQQDSSPRSRRGSLPLAGELDATSFLAALAQQNNLLGALTRNCGDSFGDYLDTEERPTAGVRGYQARQQSRRRWSGTRTPSTRRSATGWPRRSRWTGQPCREPRCARSSRTRCRLVPCGASRSSPHSSGKPRSGTTWLRSKLRWLSYSSLYLEQVAVDGGRHQLGWLLTGMPNPPFQLVQAHSQRAQEDPVGFLGDPRWVAANLAYRGSRTRIASRVAQSLWAASRRPRTGLERRRARRRQWRRELRRQSRS